MTAEEVRLECLKLAKSTDASGDPKKISETARIFIDVVIGR